MNIGVRFRQALGRALKETRPEIYVDDQGYVASIEDNLLPGITREDFADDLNAGAGSELESKFLAAHSSSALAVNCFAPSGGRDRRSGLAGTRMLDWPASSSRSRTACFARSRRTLTWWQWDHRA